jgi:hypothetical protein
MIGTVLRRRRDRAVFRVVGRDGSHWVLGPERFGPSLSVSELEIRELFSVVSEAEAFEPVAPAIVPDGMSVAEAARWDAMRATVEREYAAAMTAPPAPRPEDVFNPARLGPQGR